jgi:hypothetical protein
VPLLAPSADLLYLRPVEVAAPFELLVGGDELLLYLRGVAVARGHGDHLPQLLELHGPRQALLALGVHQAVEAPREVPLEGVVEVRVEAFQVACGEGARQDVAELERVVLAGPALALLLAECHFPQVEAVALKVLVRQGVEGVLGVDVR